MKSLLSRGSKHRLNVIDSQDTSNQLFQNSYQKKKKKEKLYITFINILQITTLTAHCAGSQLVILKWQKIVYTFKWFLGIAMVSIKVVNFVPFRPRHPKYFVPILHPVQETPPNVLANISRCFGYLGVFWVCFGVFRVMNNFFFFFFFEKKVLC